jgi:hypothetical protein
MACAVFAVLLYVDTVDNVEQSSIAFLLPVRRAFVATCKHHSALCNNISFCSFARQHQHILINSTHFGYRLLEYNVGVCFLACIQSYPVDSTKFTHTVKYLHPVVSVIFLLVWWTQLGASVQANYCTCICMYSFSPCIQVHHGFLMRGCFLGITVLCKITLSVKDVSMFNVISHGNIINTQGSWLASGITTVVLV